MEAAEKVYRVRTAVTSVDPRLRLFRRRTTPAVGDALAEGLGRLVEGQRQFAEEFGLPYGRVFSPGFEGFRHGEPVRVIKGWFADREGGQERIQALFQDLVAHQMALISAVDGAVLHALNADLANADGVHARRLPLWAKVVRAVLPRRRQQVLQDDQTLRYLYLVAPAFVAAYAKARETLAQRDQQ